MVGSPRPTTKVKPENGPELFFGIVGAVGTDLRTVVEVFKESLRAVNYIPREIRLSGLISDCYKYRYLKKTRESPEDERIDAYMDAGDDLRRATERGDAVALLALNAIRNIRESERGKPDEALPRYVYILNSLKHPDEVKTLAKTYGEAFFLISIYAPRNARIRLLAEKIAKSRHKFNPDEFRDKAEYLVDKDEKEVGDEFGQNVRDTFPLADLFIAQRTSFKEQLERFINLLYGYPYTTPTVDEHGMFHAKSAALRSADLSRQVGAVITTDDGQIIAAGCNEVPKAKGGAVWEGRITTDRDYRDFRRGHDASDVMKHEIITEIFESLRKKDWLSDKVTDKTSETLAELALEKSSESVLRDTRVSNLIEFGTSVHAEMFAITDAARRGVSVENATLYCTTFPCHMCARHIIAAGIQRVIYIEPYPKGMAKDLYKRSISVDGDEADEDAVMFESFVGIAPPRYTFLFEITERKDDRGYTLEWDATDSQPRLRYRFPTYLDVEKSYAEVLMSNAVDYGLTEAANSFSPGEQNNAKKRLAEPPNEGSKTRD